MTEQSIELKRNWAHTAFNVLASTFKFGVFLVHMLFTGSRGAFEKCKEEWNELESSPKNND